MVESAYVRKRFSSSRVISEGISLDIFFKLGGQKGCPVDYFLCVYGNRNEVSEAG